MGDIGKRNDVKEGEVKKGGEMRPIGANVLKAMSIVLSKRSMKMEV